MWNSYAKYRSTMVVSRKSICATELEPKLVTFSMKLHSSSKEWQSDKLWLVRLGYLADIF